MSTYDDEIRALAEATLEHDKAATDGPWRWGDWQAEYGRLESEFQSTLEHNPVRGDDPARYTRSRDDRPTWVLTIEDDQVSSSDKRFIAHARTAAPELARAVLELLRYRQAVTEALNAEHARLHGEEECDGPLEDAIQDGMLARIRAAISRKLEAGRG